MRGLLVLVCAFAATGCIESGLVDCNNGLACPTQTVCAQLVVNDESLCVTPDQINACTDAQSFASCALRGGDPGACYETVTGLVCLPSGCGNGLVDPQLGEACDDGNAIVGDGCSYSCRSNEKCGNGFLDPVRVDMTGNPIPGETCDDGNLVGHDGCSSGCGVEGAEWQLVTYDVPLGLQDAAATYDAVRDRVVMFGGGRQAGNVGPLPLFSDTWEWDGVTWAKIPVVTRPSPRARHAMAYDRAHERVVMFGGFDGTARDDTWEWDGQTWTQREGAWGVPARSSHAMAYDAARSRIVMFGGGGGPSGLLDDTWAWDGTTWSPITSAIAPSARAHHAMAYDPIRGVIVMAGGVDATGAVGDTWELDGTTWRQMSAMTPPALAYASMAWDPVSRRMITFGGAGAGGATSFSATFTSETWTWDGHAWALATTAGPEPRALEVLATDAARHQVIMFGGNDPVDICPDCPGTLSDSWKWDGTTWTQIPLTTSKPPALVDHAVGFDPLRGRTLVFGGRLDLTFPIPNQSNATWLLAGSRWTQVATPGPSARDGTAIAYDAAHDQFVLFGGKVGLNPNGETWIFDGSTWTHATPATSPAARMYHTMAYDPTTQRIVLYGGGTPSQLRDTWEWDGTTWSLRNADSPGGVQAASAYDPIRRAIVRFGGQDGMTGIAARQSWSWDHAAGTWTNITPGVTPNGSLGPSLIWDGARRRLVAFGALGSSGAGQDAWEWDGAAWKIVLSNGPLRTHHVAWPGVDGAGMVVFGGAEALNTPPVADVYRLRWNGTGADEACVAGVDSDGDGLAGCADPDCWPVCAPLCPPGATCDPTWPHCGDGVCRGRESCRSCAADCGACPAVCGDTFCDPGETPASCPGDCH